MCQLDQLPGVIWTANADMTNEFGTTCRRLEAPLPGSGSASVLRIANLLRRLLEVPL